MGKKPTPKQKKAFKIAQSFIKDPDKDWTWFEVLRKAGYAESTARQVSPVRESDGWKELLSRVDDKGILENVENIAKDEDDKRVAVNAAKEIFKLKGRYPKKGVKVDINDERKEVFEPTEAEKEKEKALEEERKRRKELEQMLNEAVEATDDEDQ